MPNSCKQKAIFHIADDPSRNVFYIRICIMGELHPDSLFPYRLRTNPISNPTSWLLLFI